MIEGFHRDGVGIVPGFASSAECKALLDRESRGQGVTVMGGGGFYACDSRSTLCRVPRERAPYQARVGERKRQRDVAPRSQSVRNAHRVVLPST